MSKRKPEYPADEFNLPNGAIERAGVHRAGRSTWSSLWPFLAVFAITFALGLGAINYLMQVPDSKVGDLIDQVTSGGTNDAGESDGSSEDPEAGATDGGTDAEGEGATDGATTDGGTEGGTDASEEPSDEPTEEVPAEINRNISVRVVNASTVTGAAARGAEKLTTDGFTSVEAANFDQGEKPTASVVYYKGADNKATAERVAELLDIPQVVSADTLRADVSVVLR